MASGGTYGHRQGLEALTVACFARDFIRFCQNPSLVRPLRASRVGRMFFKDRRGLGAVYFRVTCPLLPKDNGFGATTAFTGIIRLAEFGQLDYS